MSRVRALTVALLSSFAFAAAAAPVFTSRHSVPPPSAQAKTAVERAYQEGVQRLATNDLDGAQRAFRRALDLQPTYANAMLGLAEIAARRGRPDEAAKLIDDAVRAEPDNAHAHASIGRLQATRRQFKEAEASLKKASELDPKLIRAKMDLADLYATTFNKPREALALYRDVLALEPDHAGAHYASGIVLEGLGDLAAAGEELAKANRLEPGNPLPMVALARVALKRKDLDGALSWAEQALKIQPTMAEALELRGDVRQLQGNADAALSDYAAALKAQPQRFTALLKQGSLLQQQGRTEAAAAAYKAAIKVNPRAAVAYNNLAWMSAETGKDLAQAETWARKAIELGPKVPDFHDTLGWVQRAQGNLKGAERSLLQATALKGATASTFYHFGVVQGELGKKREAEAALKKALALDKDHSKAAAALQQLGAR